MMPIHDFTISYTIIPYGISHKVYDMVYSISYTRLHTIWSRHMDISREVSDLFRKLSDLFRSRVRLLLAISDVFY